MRMINSISAITRIAPSTAPMTIPVISKAVNPSSSVGLGLGLGNTSLAVNATSLH